MDDLIRRQAAIDALCAACGKACDKSKFVYNAPQYEQVILCPEHYCLCTLPSTQPTIEPTIIHCSECRHADWRFPGNGLAYCYCMAHSRGGLKGDDYCSYGEREVAE